MLEICEYALVSFLVVIRVWREIWHEMLSNDKEGRQNGRVGQREAREREGKGAGRILRSACKPISISSEIRLSEFLVMRARLSDRAVRSWFIGPLLALAPWLQDSSQYPLYYATYTRSLSNQRVAIFYSVFQYKLFYALSVLFKEMMVNFRSFLNYTLSIY